MAWCTIGSFNTESVRKCKFVRKNPNYVGSVKHKVPGSNEKISVKSGTQADGRRRQFLKCRVAINQYTKASIKLLRAELRSARCDVWMHCGRLDAMSKFY